MRKSTKSVALAFAKRLPHEDGSKSSDGAAFFVHGNKIAEYRGNEVFFTLAGWDKKLTRDVLNSLFTTLKIKSSIFTKDGETRVSENGYGGKGVGIMATQWFTLRGGKLFISP